MDLHSSIGDGLDSRSIGTGPGLATDLPPSTTVPPGPRRIHDRRGMRRLRRVGLAALAGLGGGLIAAWALAAQSLPPVLRLPQPAAAMPATDLLIPMLLAALGLAALWRLSAWVLPLVMAGLLLGCGLPMLLDPGADPLDLLTSAPLLSVLGLPVLAAVLNRTLLRRAGLTGRLANRREMASFALLGGLVAPLAAGLLAWGLLVAVGLTRAGASGAALELAGAWALGLLSAGTALQASSQRPRRSGRWTGRWIAVAAIATQLGLAWLPDPGALLLAPHLLLCLHALQAPPRHNAGLGASLLVLWAASAAASPLAYAAGALLAALPLVLIALSQHQLRDRDGWRSALDAQGLALAEWRLPEGQRHASARWVALTTPVDPAAGAGSAPLDWVRIAHPRDRETVRRALRDLLSTPERNQIGLSLRLAADGGDWRWHEL